MERYLKHLTALNYAALCVGLVATLVTMSSSRDASAVGGAAVFFVTIALVLRKVFFPVSPDARPDLRQYLISLFIIFSATVLLVGGYMIGGALKRQRSEFEVHDRVYNRDAGNCEQAGLNAEALDVKYACEKEGRRIAGSHCYSAAEWQEIVKRDQAEEKRFCLASAVKNRRDEQREYDSIAERFARERMIGFGVGAAGLLLLGLACSLDRRHRQRTVKEAVEKHHGTDPSR